MLLTVELLNCEKNVHCTLTDSLKSILICNTDLNLHTIVRWSSLKNCHVIYINQDITQYTYRISILVLTNTTGYSFTLRLMLPKGETIN